jgi:hypothetical protein
MPGTTITSREWRRVMLWSALILAASCLPYLVAWLATPVGYQFSGLVVNPWDGHSYLAKMREGWLGVWQYHVPFTPEPHPGSFIFLYYLALGHLARLIGLTLALTFHIARLVGGLALLVAVYNFIARITAEPRERTLAFWLVAMGAGLGWLGLAWGAFAIDLWVPEAFTFYSFLANPHFPLATALMLVLLTYVAWPPAGWRCALIPAAAGLALALVQPFAVLPLFATLALYLAWRGRRERAWLRAGLVATASATVFAAPVVGYDYLVYGQNPILAQWAAQNVSPTPPIADVLLGCGLLALLAIPGALVAWRQIKPAPGVQQADATGSSCSGAPRGAGEQLVLAWAIAALLLAYVPLDLQRRFLAGLTIPLGILAALGLNRWLLPRLAAHRRPAVLGAVVVVAALGNLFLLLTMTLPTVDQNPAATGFALLRLSDAESVGMAWLLAHAPNEIVFATPRTGAFLPGQAGVRVFAGHPAETADAKHKLDQATAFFVDRLPSSAWQELRSLYGIHYVFVGPAERVLGGANWRTQMAAEGIPIFKQDEVTIYRLR